MENKDKSSDKAHSEPLQQYNVSYSEIFSEEEREKMDNAMKDYFEGEKLEQERINKANNELLETLKYQLPKTYFKAINEFLNDAEHGIYGEIKIVEKPIGEWQYEINEYTENQDYWNELKGMYVNQSCGYSGDDFSGTLEIKIDSNRLLRCLFSL